MKRITSILLTLAMIFTLMPMNILAADEPAFKDMTGSEYYAESAEILSELGILAGYEDGTYGAEKTITRAEMAAIVCRILGKEADAEQAKGKTEFDDVAADHWASGYINIATKEGIINGDGNGKFRPEDDVKYEEAIKMLVCALGYAENITVDPKDWSKAYLDIAEEKGFTENLKGKKGEAATRGDIAVMSLNGMESSEAFAERLGKVAKPVASVKEGEYKATQKVKLTTTTEGATIYYTTDGKVPTVKSTKYTKEISISKTTTLKAIAVKNEIVSDVMSITYTIKKVSGGGGGGGSSTPSTYSLSFASATNGTIDTSVAGSYSRNSEITLTATPADGYSFVKWSSNNGGTFENANATTTKFTMPSSNVVISATFAEIEAVPTEIAELFGINPDDYDTDNDGLSNYIEIYVTGTEPALDDSDEDGILDADEDFDEDGLTNKQEIDLGTDPSKADTDNDGLNDYAEINTYNTNPVNNDSDEDGLSDGDEILLELNPLVQKTDGITLDSERTFTQELSENNISEKLLSEDNDAVPTLTLTASGNINNDVVISATSSNDFSDSRAIVGEAIDISGESVEEGTLTFTLQNSGVSLLSVEDTSDTFNTNLICKYNEDGSTDYLDTEYDETNNTVSANINGEGTYFVLDVKNLFDELGLAMPTVADINALSDPEPIALMSIAEEETDINSNNNQNQQDSEISLFSLSEPIEDLSVSVASADTEKITLAASSTGGAMAQADIVFIIDTTGSMGDEITNVKNNINSFVDVLKAKGVSAGLALIDYQDIEHDGYDSTRVHKNGTSNWFYDLDAYKDKIANLYADDGGDTPECVVDALETARLLDMRASAGKIFILVTDADYKVANRYGIPSMAAEIELLKNAGVSCSVVSPSSEQYTYYNLYTDTNGIWANIYGNFNTELTALADRIGDEIVGDGYWIYLQGPVPVPVRLDEMPSEDGTADTDEDGILDKDELESTTPTGEIDLDDLITKVSKGAITGTEYGIVKMYKYKSSPVEEDSDFDGIKDADENTTETLVNTFNGRMLGYYDVADANYTFDYRQFFKSASSYSDALCSASLMFSNAIYNDCGFRYNSGKELTDISEMMKYHGFENVIDYKLANGFANDKISVGAYNDDDISEIGIGYHTVTYNGTTKTILGIVIRGTNGTIEEWSSNFDMGDTESWNEDIHKGFYITEERIKHFVDMYVNAYLGDAENLTYWITGHSRGAALANVLAARIIDNGNKVYAYTFATPSTTISSDKNAAKYNAIFNFANTSDFVTYVPLKEWNFGAFGVTRFMSIEDSNLENEWASQTGVSNYNALSKSVITLATSRIAKSCCSNWDEVHDRAGSQDINDEQYGYISSRAKRYCDLTERNSMFGNHKGWKLYPSTAFIFQLGAEMLAGSDAEKTNVKELIPELWNSRYTGVILLFLGDAALNWDSFDGMELSDTLVGDGHAPATYYVLTQN